MQPVNDDMDNLFRRAADDYPLHTGGADFDKVLQKMQDSGEAAPPPPPNQRKRNYSWLLLLLLLFPFVCRYYRGSEEGMVQEKPTQTSNRTDGIKEDFSTRNDAPVAHDADKKNSITRDEDGSGSDSSARPAAIENNTNHKEKNTGRANTSSGTNLSNPANSTPFHETIKHNDKPKQQTATQKAGEEQAGLSADVRQKHDDKSQAYKQDTGAGSSNAPGNNRMPVTAGKDSAIYTYNTDTATTADKNTTAFAKAAGSEEPKDSTGADTTAVVKQQKEKKKQVSYFYAGATAGVDYSVVKSTQTAGTGYNAGLVAGYRFGKHWAVETGFIWAYKKYSSDGKYVTTDRLELAMHTQVLNANGSCGIFEIPVKVQYHFGGNKSHWYAGAGLSSYLMKKEDYYYVGKRYNMVYYAEKEYYNSSRDWFSVLQLNGGYQWQWGRRSSLRAEPYVKLPLSKIGIARLPLSSAGINIGYIRAL